MIVVGYQAIGKSSVVAERGDAIDLESSNFYIGEGESRHRPEGWAEIYANIAEDLSCQGFIVFTSSHKAVQDAMVKTGEKVIAVFPALKLKDEWLKRLKDRYDRTKSDKDYRAWKGAEAGYEKEISAFMEIPCEKIVLDSVDYNLNDYVDAALGEDKPTLPED